MFKVSRFVWHRLGGLGFLDEGVDLALLRGFTFR